MDEIEYKLKTNNPVLVVNAIEKLISSVKSKFKPIDRQQFVLNNEELKFLREKCSVRDTVISLTACQGLLALVECGVLEIGHTMSTVITLLASAQNYSAIISTMSGLLALDLRSRLVPGKPYTCQFSLRSPQHPFITVLEKNRAAADDILSQMHALCNHPDYVISLNSLTLLRSVFLWLACRPEAAGPRPWRLLLSLRQNPGQADLLLTCLSYQQISNPKLIQSSFAAFSRVTETAIYQQQREYVMAVLPVLARLSNELIRNGSDPRTCYNLMEKCFELDAPELRNVAGLTVALLAENLNISCAVHLYELFNLCLNIISKHECSATSINIFIALTLQWLHLPSVLTTNALKVASKIVELYLNNEKEDTRLYMPNLQSNREFQTLLYTDRKILITFNLFKTYERIRDNPTKLSDWFDSLTEVDAELRFDFAPFFFGILLERSKEGSFEIVFSKSLKFLVDLVDVEKDFSVQLLPVLIFKIGNDTSPRMKMECLRALPLMAKTKENVPIIISVLNKLKAQRCVPTSFLIHLYMIASELQARCLPYLQECMAMDDRSAEADIARATAICRIAEIRPSQGLELVSSLSSVLNAGSSRVAVVQCARAVRRLWAQRALGTHSTWHALENKLGRDKRPDVMDAVCELLSVLPSLRSSSPECAPLLRRAASHLWARLSEDGSAAAAEALAHYELDDYTLADVPEIYRSTVKLPSSFCKTPIDAARKPEEVLDYIPCEIWPEVYKLSSATALQGVHTLCRALVEREVRALRGGAYRVAREDTAPKHLPAHSVCRGLLEFVRKQVTSPSYDCPDSILLEVLTTLSSEFSKPLPPSDLSHLHDLFHRGRMWRQPCLTMAARQAAISGSARRFMDNYLVGFEPDSVEESDIIMIFEMLPALCRSMPPNSLRKPIEKCLSHAYSLTRKRKAVRDEEISDCLFVRLSVLVKECLDNEKIHDANRTLLAQIVESYYEVVKEDNESWLAYTSVVGSLPPPVVERLTSPSGWWEVSSAALRTAVQARTGAATGMGVHCLDELVDAAADCVSEHEFILRSLKTVLFKVKRDDKVKEWLMQLMARTQVAFTESENESTKSFFWTAFTMSVIIVSGVWSLDPCSDLTEDRERMGELFPAAAACLFSRKDWSDLAPKVLECLCHTRKVHSDIKAALSCKRAITCMKDQEYFTKTLWNKALCDTRVYEV